MVDYPQAEGKHGPIYQIAEGVRVGLNQFGSWEVLLKRGGERKKKAIGRGEENLQRAVTGAERLAKKLGLVLEEKRDRTFGEMSQEWFSLNSGRWRPNTQERYRGIIQAFLQPLYPLPLGQVDRAQVKRLLVDLMQIRAPKSVEVVHAVISGIFSEAIDLGYTQGNPAYGLLKRIMPPKNRRNLQDPDPLCRDDMDRFLEAAWAKLPEPLALILEVMAMTGMRLGEALAVNWENLDVRNCQYRVTETARQGSTGPPKSGNRLIDLDATLVGKLEVYGRGVRKASLAEGTQSRYLFPGISQRMVQGAVKRACRVAGLRARSPHDLRHTYATLLLMDHYSPAYVQKQLGHHSISMTVDIYGHWIPGEGRKDLEMTLRQAKAPRRPLSLVEGKQ